ncbi:hypothetical protein BX666DRAFT_1991083 [Dichotomocladium elegans]|nr:hypothetical protein BX666DRAFT_1991083 [Dichotomocladium elegans]
MVISAPYMLVGYPVSSSSSPNFGDTFVKLLTTLTNHHNEHVAAEFMVCSSDVYSGRTMTEKCFSKTVFDTNLFPHVLEAAHDYAAATTRDSEDPPSYFGHDADKAVRQYMDQQKLLETPLQQHTITPPSSITSSNVFDDCEKKIRNWFQNTHGNGISLSPSEDDGSVTDLLDENSEADDESQEDREEIQLSQSDEIDEGSMSTPSQELCRNATGRQSSSVAYYIDQICEAWLQNGSCDRKRHCPFKHQGNNSEQEIVLADEDFPELSKHQPIRIRSPSLPNYADVARRSATTAMAQRKPSLLAIPAADTLTSQLARPARIPWLETGSPLMQLYHNERKRAHELGGQMNRYFKLSQKCYHRQDWCNAREYAEEARYYQQEMKRLHTQASRRIFEQRNQQDALFIDLHGMHVDEAKESILQWFKELETGRYRGIVYVVTGTGHHSRRGSKLRPAVASFLKTLYRCEETSVLGDNKGGVFAVYFCSHRYASPSQNVCVSCKFKLLPK